MGLFDFLNGGGNNQGPGPQQGMNPEMIQAMLAAASVLNPGYTKTPQTFGSQLPAALGTGVDVYAQAQQRKAQLENMKSQIQERDMQQKLVAQKIKEMELGDKYRQAVANIQTNKTTTTETPTYGQPEQAPQDEFTGPTGQMTPITGFQQQTQTAEVPKKEYYDKLIRLAGEYNQWHVIPGIVAAMNAQGKELLPLTKYGYLNPDTKTVVGASTEQEPVSDIGKLVKDRAMLVQSYGQDSPIIKAIDQEIQTKGRTIDQATAGLKEFEAVTGISADQRGTPEYKKAYLSFLQNKAGATHINVNMPSTQQSGAMADLMAEGQLAPSLVSKRGALQQTVYPAVKEKYPGFDFNKAEANYKYMTNPGNLRSIGLVQTARPRVEDMIKKAENLQNLTNIPIVDIPLNEVRKAVGSVPVADFESLRNAILQEVNTALSGSSTQSDYRIRLEMDNFKSGRTINQLRVAGNNLLAALDARTDASLAVPYPWDVVKGIKTMDQWQKETQTSRNSPANPSPGGGKKILKQFFSPSTGKTKYVYSDGTEEIK